MTGTRRIAAGRRVGAGGTAARRSDGLRLAFSLGVAALIAACSAGSDDPPKERAPTPSDAAARERCAPRPLDACVEEGFAHSVGRGVPKDGVRAEALLGDACEQRHARGCYLLALMLQQVGDQPARVRDLFSKSCDLGSARACHNLAALVDAANPAESLALLVKACELGEPKSCFNAALMVEKGRGGAADLGRAIGLFRRACDGGDGFGCTNLGKLYESGRGVDRDVGQAASLYEKACSLGDDVGCRNLDVLRVPGARR